MKLQAIHDDVVYATDGRRILRERPPPGGAGRAGGPIGDGGTLRRRRPLESGLRFEPVGRLPVIEDGIEGVRERLLTSNPWKRALEAVVGSHQTVNLWVFPEAMVATVRRDVLVSHDGGRTWDRRLTLPASSIRMGVLPSCVCRHEGAIYIAEYPLAEDATPAVHRSTDGGRSWERFLELPSVRHVHSIASDPYGGDLWLTTGDRDEECRLVRIRDGDPDVVGGGSQDWRIVEPAFTRDAIVWGVDCGYADRNRIFRLSRSELDAPSPTPDPVGAVSSSVYYSETLEVDGTEWVVLSTAAESGGDRTAPDAETTRDRTATVVAASADSGFTEWTTLCRYRRRSPLADRSGDPPRLPSANAYVLLASSPERGLFVNPYNTAADDGAIRRIHAASFST